jgi:hypothetical protein
MPHSTHPAHHRFLCPPLRLAVLLLITAGATVTARADAGPGIFKGADLAEGQRLIAEHRCAACHARKVGGDGASIYRPDGRINSPARLRGMVEMCNTELNLGMFPEEVTSVAAVLQRDHYRFGAAAGKP